MSELELDCEIREQKGSAVARRLRATGLLPAVIYGHEKEPELVSVAASDFQRLYVATRGHTAVLTLNIKTDGRHKKENVIVKEVQRHPTREAILCVDFQRVSLRERVRVDVAIVLVGRAPGVEAGGTVDQVTRELHVECPVAQMPETIEADISRLEIGDVLTAADLVLPTGATLLSELEAVIATVVPPRVEEVAAPAPEITEAAEPELIRPKREEEEEPEA